MDCFGRSRSKSGSIWGRGHVMVLSLFRQCGKITLNVQFNFWYAILLSWIVCTKMMMMTTSYRITTRIKKAKILLLHLSFGWHCERTWKNICIVNIQIVFLISRFLSQLVCCKWLSFSLHFLISKWICIYVHVWRLPRFEPALIGRPLLGLRNDHVLILNRYQIIKILIICWIELQRYPAYLLALIFALICLLL